LTAHFKQLLSYGTAEQPLVFFWTPSIS